MSLTSSQSAGERERALDDFVKAFAVVETVERQTGGHIVVNRHGGKRVGFLEDHADAAANLHCRSSVVDIHFADAHPARGPGFWNRLVHAVEAAHEGGLAAAGGTNHGGGVIGGHRHVDVLQSLGLAEPGVQLVDLDANAHNFSSLP